MATQIGDVYQCRIHWRIDGQLAYNVLHAAARNAYSEPNLLSQQLEDLLNKISGVSSQMRTVMHETVECLRVDARFVAGAGDPHMVEREAGTFGTVTTSDMLPGFVAGVVNHSTGLAGRSRKGRTHVLGLCEEHADGGRLSTAGEAALTTISAALANNWLAQDGWDGVVFSPTLTATTGVLSAFRIQSFSWSPLLGTMYSRRIGVGG